MDPDQALELLRLHLRKMSAAETQDLKDHHATLAAEYARALDEWLSRGGYLPQQWGIGRHP